MSYAWLQPGQTVTLSLNFLLTIGIQNKIPVKSNKQTIHEIEVHPCFDIFSKGPVYSQKLHLGLAY